MIRNYFSSDTHYNREEYHRKQPISTGRPRTSPEGPLKVLTSETYKGPSVDSQKTYKKIHDFIKKIFFRSNSPCIISVFLFLQEVAGRPWDQMMGRSKYVRGTPVKHVYKLNSQTN